MWVSTETIYQSLYVQSRGALRRDLAKYLRTGRGLRQPNRQGAQRKSRVVPDMINIAARPVEADDRAVPGHWEGDLIIGKATVSAIGTLVERTTGYTMLVHLPMVTNLHRSRLPWPRGSRPCPRRCAGL